MTIQNEELSIEELKPNSDLENEGIGEHADIRMNGYKSTKEKKVKNLKEIIMEKNKNRVTSNSFRNKMDKLIAGTYPHDDRPSWYRVIKLDLITVMEKIMELGWGRPDFPTYSDFKKHRECNSSPDYLWLNKGYILLEEDLAMYLHDGEYTLIKKRDSYPVLNADEDFSE